MEDETITLKTVSEFDSKGIDLAIAKYTELEKLHAKLSNMPLKFTPVGLTELNRELKEMGANLSQIGAARAFDQLTGQMEAGLTRMRGMRGELEQMQGAFNADVRPRLGESPDAFSTRQVKARTQMASMQKAIAEEEARVDAQVAERRGLRGAAIIEPQGATAPGANKPEAMEQKIAAKEELTTAAKKCAEAEAVLNAKMVGTTAAAEKQDAATRKKGQGTKQTEGAIKQLSDAEKKLEADMTKTAAAADASTGGARRYVKKNGEGEIIEEGSQISPSDTEVRRGEEVVRTHKDMAKAVNDTAAAEQNYKVAMRGAGDDLQRRLLLSKDFAASVRAQREALPSAATGSPEEKSITGALTRANAAVAAHEAGIERANRRAAESAEKAQMSAAERVAKIEDAQLARQAAARKRVQDRQADDELKAMGKREEAAEKLAEKEAAHQLRVSQATAAKSNVNLQNNAEMKYQGGTAYSNGEHTSVTQWEQLNGTMRETITVHEKYNATGELVEHQTDKMSRAVKDLGRTGDWTARSFLHNTFVVAAWATSVGAFYAALSTLRSGAEAAVDIERKFGTLETVFHSSRAEALELRDSVLELASEEGRSADEAMDAATKFSRLGLSRVEVIEATTQALKASNIAQISTAESSQYLSAIMVGYGLHAKDLSVVLNQLNAMAISYNVTNAEMLEGISRVSSLAQRAKLPLTELAGLIAAGVGATGRPGGEFGNAIKAVITSINTPSKQKKLDEDYGIEVKTGNDDLKDMSTILGELYVRYQHLTGAQQASLLQVIGQRQQGARLASMLDNYVASQVLAIRSQTDLNSAERENMNIRATMSSQLQTLETEFQRMAVNLVASGQNISVSNGVQQVLQMLSNGMKMLGDHPTVLSSIIVLLTMMAAKMALLAIATAATDKGGNFFLNTIKQITMATREMGVQMTKSNEQIATLGALYNRVGEKINASAGGFAASLGGLRAVGGSLKNIGTFLLGALVDLIEYIPYMAVFAAGMWLVNKAFEYFRGSAQAATDAAAGLNDQLERANNLGGAAAQSARLLATIEKAAPDLDDKGFRKAAHGVAEIEFPGLDDDRKRQALEDTLKNLREQGRYDEIGVKLEALRAAHLADANKYRTEALNITRRQLAAEQGNVQALQAQIEAKNKAGEPAEDERQKLRDAQDRVNTLTQKGMQDIGDEMDEATADVDNPVAKLAESWMKGVQKGLDDFSGKIATDGTATDKLREEIQLLETKKNALDDNAAAARREYDAAESAAQARISAAKKALEAARDYGIENARAGLESQAHNVRVNRVIGGGNRHNGGRVDYVWEPNQASRDLDEFDKAHAGYYQTMKNLAAAIDGAKDAEVGSTKALKDNRDARDAANEKAQEALDIARKELDAQKAYATALDAAEEAQRGAQNIGRAGKYGNNEGERIWNEAQGAYRSLGKDWIDEMNDRSRSSSTQDQLLSQVQTEAAIREKLKMLRDAEVAAAQRQAEIEAEIQQTMLKQNEEASKALLMGSRKEQMETAMIARFLQRRGGQGFSANEFMFLDQSTKESIAKFFPSAAPAGAGSEIDKLLRERAEMPEIRNRLAQERAGAAGAFGDFNASDTARRYAGPNFQQPPVPEIALNLGGVHIDIGDQFARLTTQFQNVVAQQLQPQIGKMGDRIAALERANAVNNSNAR